MEKEFVSFEIALELKELGFDESCFAYFVDGELRGINLGMEELGGIEPYYQRFKFHTLSNHDINNPNKIIVTSPLYQQAFRFFREKYNMLANVYSNASGFCYEYSDTIGGTHRLDSGFDGPNDSGCWDSYEDAELACLQKMIKMVKNI